MPETPAVPRHPSQPPGIFQKTRFPEFQRLYRNLFDFVQGDGVAGAVVEFGRPCAFVRGDLLSLFERPTVFEIERLMVPIDVRREEFYELLGSRK